MKNSPSPTIVNNCIYNKLNTYILNFKTQSTQDIYILFFNQSKEKFDFKTNCSEL